MQKVLLKYAHPWQLLTIVYILIISNMDIVDDYV